MALLICTRAFGGQQEGNYEVRCSAQLAAIAGDPIVGTIHLKVLLVEFQDVHCRKGGDGVSPRYSSKDFEDLLGSEGVYVSPAMYSPDGGPVYGSMNDYYQAMSGGIVRIEATVINATDRTSGLPSWVTLPHVKLFYEQDTSKDSIFVESERAASDAGLDVTTSADTKLAIIYAGNTYYKAGGLNPVTWENRYIMSEVQGRPYNQENADAQFSRIGIHCHEFAHTIGIGHSSGSGADLMCSGTKNGSVEGNVPAPLNPIARMKMGWASVVSVDSIPGGEAEVGYSLKKPVVYRMRNANGDYFLIENRRFDQTMKIGSTDVPDYNNAAFFPPARPHGKLRQGMLVWRVNAIGDILDPGYSTEGLVYASGRYGRTFPENEPSETDDGVPFPGVCNVRVLSPWSDPRNPYTRESDFFGANTVHYTLFVPNTKGASECGMEVLSEDGEYGSFRVRFYTGNPPNPALESALAPDSVGVCQNLRTVRSDPEGVTHQLLEIGGEIFYRSNEAGVAGWRGVRQLSNGNGGNSAPSVTLVGRAILVVWQVRAAGANNYVLHLTRSTDSGASWSGLMSPASAYNCTESGAHPSVVMLEDGRAILVYCAGPSIFSSMSGTGGRSWSSPVCTFTFNRIWGGPSLIPTRDSNGAIRAALAFGADSTSGDSQIFYATFDFNKGRWEKVQNVSDGLPSQYASFSHPCFEVNGPNLESRPLLLWDAIDSSHEDQKVIVCRDATPDVPGFPFRIIGGRSLDDLSRKDLLGMISTGIEERGPRTSVETGFALEQNYPNPFNPTTGVRFSVPTQSGRDLVSTSGRDGQVPGVSNVKLVVFDLLGREVAVLVNERKAPGSYEATFNANGLASGVYVYRLTAGSFVQSRKMVLVK